MKVMPFQPVNSLLRYALAGALIFVTQLLSPCTTEAAEKNGMRLEVQKKTLDREKDRDYSWDIARVDKALAIQCEVKNTGFNPREAGEINYAIVVKRWGYSPSRYDLYEGTETLPPLKPAEDIRLIMGRVPLGGYETPTDRKKYMDSIEGWRVIITHSGTETVRALSNSSFDKLYERAEKKNSFKSKKDEAPDKSEP
jgi:hypothetical protein